MAIKTSNNSHQQAQNRLLDAAEQLFAESGYEGTSVRDITAKADCNVAAVNYHFGGKENLYLEVFRNRMRPLREIRIAAIEKAMSKGNGKPSLENLLRAFAIAFLEPFSDRNHSRQFVKLMTHEMLDHRLTQTMFIDEVVAPVTSALLKALTTIIPDYDEITGKLCIHSVVGQLVHVIRIREMFEGIDDPNIPAFDLAGFIDHIVEFSAAGIRTCKKEKPKCSEQ